MTGPPYPAAEMPCAMCGWPRIFAHRKSTGIGAFIFCCMTCAYCISSSSISRRICASSGVSGLVRSSRFISSSTARGVAEGFAFRYSQNRSILSAEVCWLFVCRVAGRECAGAYTGLSQASFPKGAAPAENRKTTMQRMLVFPLDPGGYLSSQAVSSQVLSAYEGLTSVFGMGTGGTPQLNHRKGVV